MISVFISYARADGSEAAVSVEKELEPPEFKVWRDKRNLDPFNDFSVEIEQAIIAADVVVVLVTPSISQSPESFVRREILYAQDKNKCIVPIRIANATVPILITHLTWIETFDLRDLALVSELDRRLKLHAETPRTEPIGAVAFVRSLIDDIINYLENTTVVFLNIAATGLAGTPGLTRGGLPATMRPLRKKQQPQTLTSGALGQAAVETCQRIVLHGAPGSGKTTALLVAAREASNAFLEDARRQVPIFCRAADWNVIDNEPLVEWLKRSAPLLPAADLQTAINGGRVALFVDGLDELGPPVAMRQPSGKLEMVDPRRKLLEKLPANISLLIATRSDALKDVGEPQGFGILEMEPLTEEQVADYLAQAPRLASLLEEQPSIGDLLQTPLTLGLLGYVAQSDEMEIDDRPHVEELSPRLRVVDEFLAYRWQHERNRGTHLASLGELLDVLGRVATRTGIVFGENDLREAAAGDGTAASTLLTAALQLGFLRTAPQGEFAFFHPSFAEYYATVHCRRYLGDQSADGWDDRLFQRIAQLGDPSFVPRLVAMTGSGFWRGEYGDQIATTLNAIGEADNAGVVDALLRLAAYSGTGFQGLAAIGDFARRCNSEVKAQFVNELSTRTMGADEVHILVGLGEPGIDAVVREYKRLEKGAPMRRQIESYLVVRARLGLS